MLRTLFLLLWIATVVLFTNVVTRDGVSVRMTVPVGKEFSVDEDSEITLNAEAEITAASCWYFILDDRVGSSIRAITGDRPTGWICEEYWVLDAEPMVLASGIWKVQEGTNVTLNVTTTDPSISVLEPHSHGMDDIVIFVTTVVGIVGAVFILFTKTK